MSGAPQTSGFRDHSRPGGPDTRPDVQPSSKYQHRTKTFRDVRPVPGRPVNTGEEPTLILPACASRATGTASEPETVSSAVCDSEAHGDACRQEGLRVPSPDTWNFQEKKKKKTMHELS